MGLVGSLLGKGRDLVSRTQGWSKDLMQRVFTKSQNGEKLAVLDAQTAQDIDTVNKVRRANNFFDLPQWNKSQVVVFNHDLTELPETYSNPNAVQEVRVSPLNKQIIEDPKLKENLPPQGVNVKVVIKKKEVFELLQKQPGLLSPAMAELLAGNIKGIEGLACGDILTALQRIEKKFGADESRMPSLAVRNILINHIYVNGTDAQRKALYDLNNVIGGTEKELDIKNTLLSPNHDSMNQTSKKDKTKQAIKELKSKLSDRLHEAGIFPRNSPAKKQEFIDDIYEANKAIVLENAELSTRPDYKMTKEDREALIDKYLAPCLAKVPTDEQDALKLIAMKMLHSLETSYENAGNIKSKSYKRLLKLNASHDQEQTIITAQKDFTKDELPSRDLPINTKVAKVLSTVPAAVLERLSRKNQLNIEIRDTMRNFGDAGENSYSSYGESNAQIKLAAKYRDAATGKVKETSNQELAFSVKRGLGQALFDSFIANEEFRDMVIEAYKNDMTRLYQASDDIKASVAEVHLQDESSNTEKIGHASVAEVHLQDESSNTEKIGHAFSNAFANFHGVADTGTKFRFRAMEAVIKELEDRLSRTYQEADANSIIKKMILDKRRTVEIASSL